MYTRISASKNGAKALEYAAGGSKGKGHNGAKARNLLVAGVNLLPESVESFERQMGRLWLRAAEHHKVQMRRIILSFSDKELDPNDPNSPYIALDIAVACVEKFYPGRQAAIYVQNDGEGGKLHVHIDVNDVSLIDGKGCTKEQGAFYYVRNNFEKIAREHFDEFGIQFDEGESHVKDKMTRPEIAYKQGKTKNLPWRKDLKDRVRDAMTESISREDFLVQLEKRGVHGTYKTYKRTNIDYILYELTDLSGYEKTHNGKLPDKPLRARSFSLGEDFDLEELDRHIARNRQKLKQVTKAGTGTGKRETSKVSTQPTPAISMPVLNVPDDTTLMLRYMFYTGIDYNTGSREEAAAKLEEGKKKWTAFKEAYPDDYKDRLDRRDVSMPSPEEKHTPVTTAPVTETVKQKEPVKTIEKPAEKPVQHKSSLSFDKDKYLKKTEAYADLVERFDKEHDLEGYDPNWRDDLP